MKDMSIIYTVKNTRPDVMVNSDLYWIFEKEGEFQSAEGALRIHWGGWLRISMTLGFNSRPFRQVIGQPPEQHVDRNLASYNYLSTNIVFVLTIIAFVFFIAMVIVYRGKESLIPLMYVSFTFFLINILILLFQIPFNFQPVVGMPTLQLSPLEITTTSISVFNTTANYEYFRNFILPVYYFLMIIYLMWTYADLQKRNGKELWTAFRRKNY